jgi:hypothetical protein
METAMDSIVPNPTRTWLHYPGDLPDGPLTDRQRAIADAVRGCGAPADFASAPAEQVVSIPVSRIPWGTTTEAAARDVREGLDRARAELERLEGLFRRCGANPFMPEEEGVSAYRIQAPQCSTRHDIVVALLRWLSSAGRVLTRAGDMPVVTGKDGAYRVAEPAAVA